MDCHLIKMTQELEALGLVPPSKKNRNKNSSKEVKIVVEKKDQFIHILDIKNVTNEVPEGYCNQTYPSFKGIPGTNIYSTSIGDADFPPKKQILRIGKYYTQDQFGKAIAFLKVAGEIFTKLKRSEKEGVTKTFEVVI